MYSISDDYWFWQVQKYIWDKFVASKCFWKMFVSLHITLIVNSLIPDISFKLEIVFIIYSLRKVLKIFVSNNFISHMLKSVDRLNRFIKKKNHLERDSSI